MRFHNKARLRLGANAGLRVAILAGQESFRIAPLLAATCWAIQSEAAPDLQAGAPIAALGRAAFVESMSASLLGLAVIVGISAVILGLWAPGRDDRQFRVVRRLRGAGRHRA